MEVDTIHLVHLIFIRCLSSKFNSNCTQFKLFLYKYSSYLEGNATREKKKKNKKKTNRKRRTKYCLGRWLHLWHFNFVIKLIRTIVVHTQTVITSIKALIPSFLNMTFPHFILSHDMHLSLSHTSTA